jgi:glutaminyl-peptide cyclotransferase
MPKLLHAAITGGLPLFLLPLLAGSIPIDRSQRAGKSATVPTYGYKVVKSYPHDRGAYTQGLLYQDGMFFEGTGLNGRSTIRKVKPETGEVLQVRAIDEKYFGEGIVIWKDRLIQLTWRAEIGFIYDKNTFEPRRTFNYTGEGWGLTHDGTSLIMSDGSETGTLRYLDPDTMRETRRLLVRDGTRPVDDLNELEYVEGEIYANVYHTDRIARISPKTGNVVGWIDMRGLLDPRDAGGVDVLNGIAYDAAKDRLFVTGKLWPKVFEIQLVPR